MGFDRRLAAALLAACVVLQGPARADEGASAGGGMVRAGLDAFRNGGVAEAARDWGDAAEAGNGRGALLLGAMYDTGQGVRRDPAAAMRWYRRAAELGEPHAMLNVAVMLDAGKLGPRDPEGAARWYRRAADRGIGRAAYDLALMYRDGDGVPRSAALSRAFMRRAATDGVGAAGGTGPFRVVDPRTDAARPTLLLAQAQRALLSRDASRREGAVALFRQAAAGTGEPAAMAAYDLGWCLENGIGAGVDDREAYRQFLRAAALTADSTVRELAEHGAASTGGGVTTLAASRAASPLPEAETPAASPAEPPR